MTNDTVTWLNMNRQSQKEYIPSKMNVDKHFGLMYNISLYQLENLLLSMRTRILFTLIAIYYPNAHESFTLHLSILLSLTLFL